MTDETTSTTLALTLTGGSDPIRGWLTDGRHQSRFDGWLDLMSLLRRVASGGQLNSGQECP